LGGYDKEEKAARAYDIAAIRCKGKQARLNLGQANYAPKEVEDLQQMTFHDLVAKLRRESSAFSRGKSKYRGVNFCKRSGRWRASISLGSGSSRKRVHLGGYDKEEKAARAYDIAAIRCKGKQARLNLGQANYAPKEVEDLQQMTFHDLVAKLRRESSAFSRGKSKYRGVSGHKVATSFQRPWEARIGRFNGKKNVFLGLFETEEEAARQYDRALIISKGLSAKTNFDIREYEEDATKLLDELARGMRRRRAKPEALEEPEERGSL